MFYLTIWNQESVQTRHKTFSSFPSDYSWWASDQVNSWPSTWSRQVSRRQRH